MFSGRVLWNVLSRPRLGEVYYGRDVIDGAIFDVEITTRWLYRYPSTSGRLANHLLSWSQYVRLEHQLR